MLGKDKLDTIEILISKSSINSYISHDEYILVNNVLRKYYRMKEEIKNPETLRNTLWKKNGVSWKNILPTKIQVSKKTKQNRLMLFTNSTICRKKKSTFIKN